MLFNLKLIMTFKGKAFLCFSVEIIDVVIAVVALVAVAVIAVVVVFAL